MVEEKPIFPLIEADASDEHRKPLKADLSNQDRPGIVASAPGSPWMSRFMWVGPVLPIRKEVGSNQFISLDFTGPPGEASRIYYALMFQLLKWNYHVEKIDETIEVNPTHREYYERTIATKGALEATIKEGLRSAAQAVADYELILHDIRKYKEILDYFTNLAKAKQIRNAKERKDRIRAAEHSLKAMYIDQVDIHTGPNSIVQMAQNRWPTVITDFIRLTEDDDTVDKIHDRLEVSKAEALVLKTKNDLFREWLKMFGTAVRERYDRLLGIATSRESSIDEYREWIKPYMVRFRSIKAPPPMSAFKSFMDISGQATFGNKIKLWAWQPYRAVEIKKAPMMREGKFTVDPDDPFTVEHYIKSPKTGLAHPDFYPWLLNEGKARKDEKGNDYHKTVADDIIEEIKKKWAKGEIPRTDPADMYYLFVTIDVERTGLRLQVGELEDIVFNMGMHVISHNALLVRFVEMECRKREIERYIEEMLGIKKGGKTATELSKAEFPDLFGTEPPKPSSELEKFKQELAEITGSFPETLEGVRTEDFQTAAVDGQDRAVRVGFRREGDQAVPHTIRADIRDNPRVRAEQDGLRISFCSALTPCLQKLNQN